MDHQWTIPARDLSDKSVAWEARETGLWMDGELIGFPEVAQEMMRLADGWREERIKRQREPSVEQLQLAFLWDQVRSRARQHPYCYGSERRNHLDAANAIADERDFTGAALEAWNAFVQQKTTGMSIFAGD